MKTQNERICVFLNDGRAGFLRIEDAERLQVCTQLCDAHRSLYASRGEA